MKACTKCDQLLPAESFSRSKRGLRSWCKKCCNADNRARYEDPVQREKRRAREYRRLYGISSEQYAEMLAAQGGLCAICGEVDASAYAKLCVDHDHATGVVRGLLCRLCNNAIGYFKDDTGRLSAAINYLGGSPE